jgi:hypothetical protein
VKGESTLARAESRVESFAGESLTASVTDDDTRLKARGSISHRTRVAFFGTVQLRALGGLIACAAPDARALFHLECTGTHPVDALAAKRARMKRPTPEPAAAMFADEGPLCILRSLTRHRRHGRGDSAGACFRREVVLYVMAAVFAVREQHKIFNSVIG